MTAGRPPTYDDLLDENRALKSRLAELTSADLALEMSRLMNLSRQEGQVMAALYDAPRVSIDRLYQALFGHLEGEGPDDASLRTVISKIRRKLFMSRIPNGIESAYRMGYSLSPQLRNWIAERLREPDTSIAGKWSNAFEGESEASLECARRILDSMLAKAAA